MRPYSLFSSAGLILVLAANSPSAAETASRQVVVNGALMNSAELLVLDIANCGSTVPDGNYWLNINTSAWGYQGGPQQGVIGSQFGAAPAPPPKTSKAPATPNTASAKTACAIATTSVLTSAG